MAKKNLKKSSNATTSRKGGDRPPFPLWRVALVFVSLVAAFNLLQWFFLMPDGMAAFQDWTARNAAWLISHTGIEVTLQQCHLYLPTSHWEVTPECTASSAIYVFTAFLLAYPATWGARIIGLVSGIVLLLVANLLRLLALAWAARVNADLAIYFHDYVWQIAFLFLVAVMWLVWLEFLVKKDAA